MGAQESDLLQATDVPSKMVYSAPNMIKNPIAVNSYSVNMLITGGNLYTIGDSANYQNAFGSNVLTITVPYRATLPSNPYIMFGCISLKHGLAIDDNGTVYGWGLNSASKLFSHFLT